MAGIDGGEHVLFGPDGRQYDIFAAVALGIQRYPLGTQMVMQDGRKYRYARAGGAALVVGNLIQASGDNTETNLTAAANAAGINTITFTAAGTEAANFYAEGYASISVTPSGGEIYKIKSHLLLASASGQVMNLLENGGLRTALTTTSRVDLVEHPFKGVIQAPATTITSVPVGVAVSVIATSGGTGWLQTAGVAAVLTAGTVIIGNRVVSPTGTAGAVGPETATATTSDNEVDVGVVMDVAANAAWSTIFLRLDF